MAPSLLFSARLAKMNIVLTVVGGVIELETMLLHKYSFLYSASLASKVESAVHVVHDHSVDLW